MLGFSALTAVEMPLINPPPPIGIDQEVEIGIVLQDLEADGALAGDDVGIVVGMHEHQVLLGRQLARVDRGGVDAVAVQDHARAEARGALDLGEGRPLRHHDGGGNAEALRVIGDALRVVAGRHGDDAALGFLRRQALQLVVARRDP